MRLRTRPPLLTYLLTLLPIANTPLLRRRPGVRTEPEKGRPW